MLAASHESSYNPELDRDDEVSLECDSTEENPIVNQAPEPCSEDTPTMAPVEEPSTAPISPEIPVNAAPTTAYGPVSPDQPNAAITPEAPVSPEVPVAPKENDMPYDPKGPLPAPTQTMPPVVNAEVKPMPKHDKC